MLSIFEYTNQLPGASGSGTKTVVAGYPAWEGETAASDPAEMWYIQAPDRGLYTVRLEAPWAEVLARKAEVQTLLASLHLSPWQDTPHAVNGHVHLDLPQGFSFDYPAGWTLYYPQDVSMMDAAVVTVASRPVAPPCANDSCQRFTTPPRTVAIEFRVGNGPTAPDWSHAPTTIGGQPAFHQVWGPNNATGAEEGLTWDVRLGEPSILGVYASLRGPDLPALRAAMNEVLASIRITPQSTQP
jgi:hypothetical protein